MEKTHSRGHRFQTSPGRSAGLAEDGAGSDSTTGSRVSERHKIEAMLRELLDARRNRKSEQLSTDQLALFAAAWEARQAAEAAKPTEGPDDQDNDTKPE